MSKRKQDSIGHDEKTKIRRMCEKGLSVEDIASIWELQVVQVEQILEGEESSTDSADSQLVNRLMKDPEELLCPLSHQLMDDPVVAADGITYERSMVEECLARMPNKSPMTRLPISTTVLNPNQHMKSMTLALKEAVVKEILSVVPKLANTQALKLLKRGEDFVRPLLPDASAKRKLAALLLLRLKLPGTDGKDIAKEVVTLLAEVQDEGSLQEAVVDMEEFDMSALLSAVDEETVSKIHGAMVSCNAPFTVLVKKELARRLASRSNGVRLKRLWALIAANLNDASGDWRQAASCLLAAKTSWLQLDLSNLGSEVLTGASRFLDDQDAAIAFAKGFFAYDLGISRSIKWPPRSTAPIYHELARRVAEDKPKERLRFLENGHGIDGSHTAIRKALAQQLQEQLLNEEESCVSNMEGLFLKLTLEDGQALPVDALRRLTLDPHQLGLVRPRELLLLAQQLGQIERGADAARVAAFAARAFETNGQGRESEEAFLMAYRFDHMNGDAAAGLAKAVTSAHDRCKALEASHNQLRERCRQLEEEECRLPRLELGSCLVWDLSSYDFSGFKKDQEQLSDKFQLPCGIKAWMSLYPKGEDSSDEGKAALYLNVNKPAVVQWTMQSGRAKPEAFEHDFSEDADESEGEDDMPLGYGKADFMPISDVNGCITLRILNAKPKDSTLKLSVQPKELLFRCEIGSSLVWDLSCYDFSGFVKGQEQWSEKFQLPGSINAWMVLYPEGKANSSEGKAALFLYIDNPAVVKWTWQYGSSKPSTLERDFSKDLKADGTPKRWGKPDFMPISEANGRITLRILNVTGSAFTLS